MTGRAPDPLREPGFLTQHQLRAVSPARDIFLTACPGSGKTRAAGVRIARLAEDGRRVAACSYTNVGVEQIRQVLSVDLRQTLGPQHFVGTLHSFLLRYVLYPFGHLATGSKHTPRLLADDAGWRDVTFKDSHKIRLPVSCFRFRPDGSLCIRSAPRKFPLDREKAAREGQNDALRLKQEAARRGIVSFDDAMYWALRVLQQYPGIAVAVAARFDELLVDEAQDTSELQLACLQALCATGRLDSLALIGDLEQSISSYTGASRTGCQALAAARGLNPIEFTENHRSSQKICDVAVHFCARKAPDRAVGRDADCGWSPEIVLYPAERPSNVVTWFRERLNQLDHSHEHAAVLARNNLLVDELNGDITAVPVRPRPLALGRAISSLRGSGTLGRRQIEKVDEIIRYAATGSTDLSQLSSRERWRYRQATMELLDAARDLDQDLQDWVRGAAAALGQVVAALVDVPAHKPGQVLTSEAQQKGQLARDVLTPNVVRLRAQTVHDIKGESRSAVLVVADHRLRSKRRGAQSRMWSSPLFGDALTEEDAEELRIAFVALTRARRYCALGLPDDTADEVLDAFQGAGFCFP